MIAMIAMIAMIVKTIIHLITVSFMPDYTLATTVYSYKGFGKVFSEEEDSLFEVASMNFIDALKSIAQEDPRQFILQGTPYGELTGEINIDDTAHNFILDTGQYWDCYQQKRKDGLKHSLAWDACGCHQAPMEMQQVLRREIEKEDENFYQEAAKYFGMDKEGYVERHKPFSKRRFRNQRRFTRKMPAAIAEKRAFLVNCGIESAIVDRAVEASKPDGFELILHNEGHAIDDILKELAEKGLRVQHQSLQGKDGVHRVRCTIPMQKGASLQERKLCVIGIPSQKRRYVSERLSSYYNVDHLTSEDMMKNIMERGLNEDEKEDVDAFSSELLQVAYLDTVNTRSGYVLEGYPMTVEQAQALEGETVVFIDMDIEEFSQFQSQKRWCPVCMHSYHLIKHPPRDPKHCDRCGTVLTIRPEDLPKTVKDRYFSWRVMMNDVLETLRKSDNLIEVDPKHDGEKSVTIIERIMKGEEKKTEYDKRNISIKR